MASDSVSFAVDVRYRQRIAGAENQIDAGTAPQVRGNGFSPGRDAAL